MGLSLQKAKILTLDIILFQSEAKKSGEGSASEEEKDSVRRVRWGGCKLRGTFRGRELYSEGKGR